MEISIRLAQLSGLMVTAMVLVDVIRGLFYLRSSDYNAAEVRHNLSIGLINFVFRYVMAMAAFGAFAAFGYSHRLTDMDMGSVWTWIGCFLLIDLLGYLRHYMLHRIRLLWAVHVVHHSSRTYNASVEVRSSLFTEWVRAPFYGFICWLGFPPEIIVIIISVMAIYDVLLHNPRIRSLGFLEHILMTPSHHRVHHGSNPQYLDKNFGMVLILWDKLFGTFEPEVEPVVYGIVDKTPLTSIFQIYFHEWLSIGRDLMKPASWRDRCAMLMKPPGWSPKHKSMPSRPEFVPSEAYELKKRATSISGSVRLTRRQGF